MPTILDGCGVLRLRACGATARANGEIRIRHPVRPERRRKAPKSKGAIAHEWAGARNTFRTVQAGTGHPPEIKEERPVKTGRSLASPNSRTPSGAEPPLVKGAPRQRRGFGSVGRGPKFCAAKLWGSSRRRREDQCPPRIRPWKRGCVRPIGSFSLPIALMRSSARRSAAL